MSPFRDYVRLLWQTARWQLLAAIALSTLLSVTEGLSLAMAFPLIALMAGPASSQGSSSALAGHSGSRFTKLSLHLLQALHLSPSSSLALLLMVVMISAGLLIQFNGMLTTLTLSITLRMRETLAARVYGAILHADWTFLTRRRSSDLTHLLSGELDSAGELCSSLVAVLSNGMLALLMLGLALYLAPLLTSLVLLGFGLIVPMQRRAGKAIFLSGDAISLRVRDVFHSSMERLQNLKVIKVSGAQDAELALFTRRTRAVAQERMSNAWLYVASARRFQMLSMSLVSGLILLGLGPLHLAASTMLVFLLAFLRLSPRLNTLQGKMNEILSDLPAFRNMQMFLRESQAQAEPTDANASAPTLHHAVTLEQVSFSYREDGPTILDEVSLSLEAGKITAIAGLSGAGKSTIADLVMGLLVPGSGKVSVDGVAVIRSNARVWRRQIGYVSQDTPLFHSSIRDNLLWAKPDATEAQLAEAIEAASAQFVSTLSQGLDTVVGDRGLMLSHGQRQRIALARVLLLQPALLILDEATNSLDLETEANILRTIQDRGSGVTTLLISHRPSAVRIADCIYLLEAGRIRTRGTWNEVRDAVRAQAELEELVSVAIAGAAAPL